MSLWTLVLKKTRCHNSFSSSQIRISALISLLSYSRGRIYVLFLLNTGRIHILFLLNIRIRTFFLFSSMRTPHPLSLVSHSPKTLPKHQESLRKSIQWCVHYSEPSDWLLAWWYLGWRLAPAFPPSPQPVTSNSFLEQLPIKFRATQQVISATGWTLVSVY